MKRSSHQSRSLRTHGALAPVECQDISVAHAALFTALGPLIPSAMRSFPSCAPAAPGASCHLSCQRGRPSPPPCRTWRRERAWGCVHTLLQERWRVPLGGALQQSAGVIASPWVNTTDIGGAGDRAGACLRAAESRALQAGCEAPAAEYRLVGGHMCGRRSGVARPPTCSSSSRYLRRSQRQKRTSPRAGCSGRRS